MENPYALEQDRHSGQLLSPAHSGQNGVDLYGAQSKEEAREIVMADPNLFDYAARYPHKPGERQSETSKSAARAVGRRDKPLRDKILSLMASGEELTPDEAARLLGETVLAIRPRFSQLKKLGKIIPTGEERLNDSGLKADVYKLAQQTWP